MDAKSEKTKLLLREAMRFVHGLRKNMIALSPHAPPEAGVHLSKHQIFGLTILSGHENMSMSELAEHTGVSNQQLTRIMDGLVENGLAERFTDPADRRSVQAVISQAGREIVEKLQTCRETAAAQWFENMTDGDLDACILHLRALGEILTKAGILPADMPAERCRGKAGTD
ncbi:hypothetical protein FACS1894211_05830 [Clostridia bacterium]|nr:hypothetical protein FACS1894211_05830 [Clostridia bacterium]